MTHGSNTSKVSPNSVSFQTRHPYIFFRSTPLRNDKRTARVYPWIARSVNRFRDWFSRLLCRDVNSNLFWGITLTGPISVHQFYSNWKNQQKTVVRVYLREHGTELFQWAVENSVILGGVRHSSHTSLLIIMHERLFSNISVYIHVLGVVVGTPPHLHPCCSANLQSDATVFFICIFHVLQSFVTFSIPHYCILLRIKVFFREFP